MQRCLCDNLITPIYDEALVYDSGANRKNKGMDHAMNRVNCHMQRHFRKYGLNGYIVTCDFRDFFNSAPYDVVYAENLKEAQNNLKKIRQKIRELGLELNEKKTRIRRFKDGFYFLKTKFFCTETGKIVRKINRKSAVRMRRKLCTFKKWVDESILTKEQAINSYYSWRGHMIRGNSYTILMRMDAYMHIILEF